ncbi:MAG: gene transfer agent family protein [Planktotalea sp.]|uniref:gene transfer agent family protein n=1 Tax=Planktotalea sp. TaxID=2029877 RepID=UPI003C7461E5
MDNPWSGVVSLEVDGVKRAMSLTLGALAELEAALGDDTLVALVERFESGAFSSRDVLALIVAGLRGGGWDVEREGLLSAQIKGGPMGAARAAAQLLARAFLLPEERRA